MFASFSLRKKILAAFTVVSVLLILFAAITYFKLASVTKRYESVSQEDIPSLRSLTTMSLEEKDIALKVLGLIGHSAKPEQATAAEKAIREAGRRFDEAAKVFESLSMDEKEKADWQAIREKDWKDFMDLSMRIVDLSKQGDKKEIELRDELTEGEYAVKRALLKKRLEKLMDLQVEGSAEDAAEAQREAHTLIVALFLLAIGGFAAAQAIGFIFAKGLSRSLSDLAGRLSVGANNVAEASAQISQTGVALSSSTTEQAASIQETASSVDEISVMVTKNADNAGRSQDVATRSKETAIKGKETVDQMIGAIAEISRSNSDIADQIEASNREISDIVKVIAEIGNKTKVINDIVFQTKLLSFNASVEAARAGEHGKGFSVVAEEVGNLAQMSGNAAQEISQMLENSIRKVEGIVEATRTRVNRLVDESKGKIATGTETAKRCGEALDEIVSDVASVNEMINEIAGASREQAQGVQEITKAMAQLDQVTQQNSATSQETASASEQLSAEANTLREVVQHLLSTVEGTSRGGSIRHAPATASLPSSASKTERPAEKTPSKAASAAIANVLPSGEDPRFEDA